MCNSDFEFQSKKTRKMRSFDNDIAYDHRLQLTELRTPYLFSWHIRPSPRVVDIKLFLARVREFKDFSQEKKN